MQISSGWLKGMQLLAPKGDNTRPTSAKVRSAVFNMLQPYLEERVVLDLFAGSGAMGFEALSRGAVGVVFMENDRRALNALKSNMEEVAKRAKRDEVEIDPFEVVAADIKSGWSRLKTWEPFDLIWADPPYKDAGAWLDFLQIHINEYSRSDSLLGFECGAKEPLVEHIEAFKNSGWDLFKQKVYGDTMVSMWQRS